MTKLKLLCYTAVNIALYWVALLGKVTNASLQAVQPSVLSDSILCRNHVTAADTFYCPEGKGECSEVESADLRCPSWDVPYKARLERPVWLQLEEEKKTKNIPQLSTDINSTPFLYLEILWDKGNCVIKTMPLKWV